MDAFAGLDLSWLAVDADSGMSAVGETALRQPARSAGALGAGTAAAHAAVREQVEMLREDRPLGPDVERLTAGLLVDGQLLERVRAAVPAPA